jgi:carboxyl-terminal processing protease
VDEPIEMSVVRDEIAKYTISNAFMIRPKVGYIKLTNFAETTGAELRDALRKLDYRNLDGLVFDLRNNPGGLLQEAIEVSETFLQKGQMIVETRGRTRGSNRPYASQRLNTDNLYPLVILINPQSASASEIVAGAIQDHDRGLIVGETSFGKGLVQSVYPLSKNAGLALTTQKWYTPSGRLIQRDYSQISQFDYYSHRDESAVQSRRQEDIKYSDLGRVVYGGGGITPDHVVGDSKVNDFQDLLAKRFAFYTFVRDFLAKNPPIDNSFQVSDAMVAEFRQHLQKRGIEFTEKDILENTDYLKRMIKYEVVYNRLGVSEAERVMLDGDPQVLKALELMPEARELATRARRQIAGR